MAKCKYFLFYMPSFNPKNRITGLQKITYRIRLFIGYVLNIKIEIDTGNHKKLQSRSINVNTW